MATSPRRQFSAQLKAEAVKMVAQNVRSTTQVAQELQINDGTFGDWDEAIAEREILNQHRN